MRLTVATLGPRLSSLGNRLLDVVLTPRCIGCGKEDAYLCFACLGNATPLPGPSSPDNAGGPNACLVSSIYPRGVFVAYAMEGAVREAVYELKYNGVRALAPS